MTEGSSHTAARLSVTEGDSYAAAVEHVFRDEWPRLVGYVARMVRDLDAAEEIVQDALVAALRRWPFAGVPDRPAAWLTTTCRNRALNHLRDTARRREHEGAGVETLSVSDVLGEHHGPMQDDRLRLIFLCCHPELPRQAQVGLTLRLVAGLGTAEIARGFFVSEATMAQRLTRAKRMVAEKRLSFEVPEVTELRDRLAAVIDVVYLVFNEGYLPRAGSSLQSAELCGEAQRLAALLTELLPTEPDPWSLLALIRFQQSRSGARADDHGELVPLPDQDRSTWDSGTVTAGAAALARAASTGTRTPLLVQAEIAAEHAQAASWTATDWTRILTLYDELTQLAPSAVVALNRAVAVSMATGPAAALAALDAIATPHELDENHLLWSVRADCQLRLGEHEAALASYRKALTHASNEVERRHIARRIEHCNTALTTHRPRGG